MNNKKTILILILVLTIGLIGLGIAYFSNSTSFENLFSTNPYGSTVTEQFISPDNWLPGDVIEKTIVATNSGNVDQAVRIKITEKWLDSNNNLTSCSNHYDNSFIKTIIDNWTSNYSNDLITLNGYKLELLTKMI